VIREFFKSKKSILAILILSCVFIFLILAYKNGQEIYQEKVKALKGQDILQNIS
jgi:hypothetical protein